MPYTPDRRDRLLRRVARRLIRSRRLAALHPQKHNARGDRLDPHVQTMAVLHKLAPYDQGGVGERRRSMERSSWLAAEDPVDLPVYNETIAGLTVRRYGLGMDVLVFLHGGGWVTGSLESHDAMCRTLAKRSGRTVISVDYPLAPEHPFPEAVERLAQWWRDWDRGPWSDVALGGDGAGGNLTAALCRMVEGVDRQLLIYPGLDATRSRPSHREFYDHDLVLSGESIDFYLDQYRPEPRDPRASPVLADDVSGLPPAVIVVAGFDPLRDEGIWYAERLREAGVQVTLLDFPGLPHGFGSIAGLVPAADDAMAAVARAIQVS